MNLETYRKSFKAKQEADFLTRANQVVQAPPRNRPARRLQTRLQGLQARLQQFGARRGLLMASRRRRQLAVASRLCPADCKCKHRWCERCQIDPDLRMLLRRLATASCRRLELRYSQCPSCKTPVNEALKCGRNALYA